MAARARTRPRAARHRAAKRGKPFYRRLSIDNDAWIWALGCVVFLAAVVFLVDVPAILAAVRDWLLETFGLALAVITGWLVAAYWAWRRRLAKDHKLFAQKAAGVIALGLFAWGALSLNHADWSLGAVHFKDVTLGGEVGQALTRGFLGKLAWLSALILAMALLAPRPSRWLARNLPLWMETAWERRWPHRALGAAGRLVSFAFSRPAAQTDREPHTVIGASLRARLDPPAESPIETIPAIFRPSIDPSAPSAPAVAVAPAPAEPLWQPPLDAPVDDDEGPDEPTQLGLDLANPHNKWQYPSVDLLNVPIPSVHRKHDNAARAQLIVDTLASFGVDAAVVEINEGPTVTQFGVEPGWEVRYRDLALKDETGKTLLGGDGRARTERVEVSRTRVRVNKITALQNDLALSLAAPSLRIEAPVPGRAIVGIEVPNDSATVVTLRSVMETKEYNDQLRKSKLTLALGRGVSGVPVVADLGKMPHLLIAGATGSGKSVCINSIISGIMMNASPEEVRFVLVDPKRVELTPYSSIPHLAFSEVIVDMDKVVGALQAVIAEMESRYKKFASVAVRNIETYNKHPRVLKKIPYWVVVIDELADLMMVAAFEVEKLICRLAQLARATGIHLVVATQRPSVDVVTGLIKANFPTRIAFAVTSMTDSRTILDMGGAEKLLGRGDMLYMPTDAAKPVRIQGVYLSDAEVERLVEFWTDDRFSELVPERADDLLEQALIEANGGDPDLDIETDDPLMEQARQLTMGHSRVSPSLFQRRLRIGYVKALKILELLEAEGLISESEGGESRRVLQATAFNVLD
ncbi:MAG: DNA translocase FtsK [Dehalococcoidia bacterium]